METSKPRRPSRPASPGQAKPGRAKAGESKPAEAKPARAKSATPSPAAPATPVAPRSRPAPQAPVVAPAATAADHIARVAVAAYFRAERRGFAPGFEIEDWLAAEAEVGHVAPSKPATAARKQRATGPAGTSPGSRRKKPGPA